MEYTILLGPIDVDNDDQDAAIQNALELIASLIDRVLKGDDFIEVFAAKMLPATRFSWDVGIEFHGERIAEWRMPV